MLHALIHEALAHGHRPRHVHAPILEEAQAETAIQQGDALGRPAQVRGQFPVGAQVPVGSMHRHHLIRPHGPDQIGQFLAAAMARRMDRAETFQ